MKKYFIVLLLQILGFNAKATTYFFSNSGKDTNTGKSADSPWKNIAKLNTLKLNPGDSILLNRGDIFEGIIGIKNSGTVQKPIVIAAYGKGPKPILTGARQLKNWKEDAGLLTAKIDESVSDLYVNGSRQTIARYPNKGFIAIDSGINRQTILSEGIKNIPGNVKGATVRVRSENWVYETRVIQSATKNSIDLVYHNLYKLDNAIIPRTDNGTKTMYELKKGYGFYIEGLPQFIDTTGEWSMRGKDVVFKPQSISAGKQAKIEAAVERSGITILRKVKNIVINDIQIEKYYFSAMNMGDRTENITVNNCKIKDVHVFGIRIDSLSRNCKITNNDISDVLGMGISVLEPEYMLVENNVVKRMGIIPGQGLSGVNAASGIIIYNHEVFTYLKSKYANHNKVRLNKVDSCGYIGIRVDGSYNLVEYNIIDNCGLTLNDGAAFYTFGQRNDVNHHLTLRRNIIRNARGNRDSTPGNKIVFNGIYIDNHSSDCLIEENTSINHSSNGIQNNAAAFNNTYTKNNIFNCGVGIGFYEWGTRIGQTYGNKVFNNTFAASDTNQALVKYTSYVANKTNFAQFDNNQYIHTKRTNPFYNQTRQIPEPSRLNLAFNDWQEIGNRDMNSTAMMADSDLLKDFAPEVIVNEAMTEKEYVFEKDKYRDTKGNVFSGPIKLGEYQSIIVLKKKVN